MKKLCFLMLAGMVLSSCNTTIGVGRDIREGYQWTKGKIDESRNKSGGYDQGPPVY
jgi:predicted small secreted protein